MAMFVTPEPLQRLHQATVEAAAERRQAALERAQYHDLLSQEPSCSCAQTDVDLFDARGCELHDPDSSWNVELRAVSPVQVYELYEPAVALECPF